jgi:hypothetical protein
LESILATRPTRSTGTIGTQSYFSIYLSGEYPIIPQRLNIFVGALKKNDHRRYDAIPI